MKHPRVVLCRHIFSILLIILLIQYFVLERCSHAGGEARSRGASSTDTVKKGTAASGSPTPSFEQASTATRGAAKAGAMPAHAKHAATAGSRARKVRFPAGEDPEFAKKKGWPVKYPEPLPGSILPKNRIVAYYGNPLSKRMGALGEYKKDDMLRRLKREADRWAEADPSHPVQPALHLIAVVAQGKRGNAGKYRMVMPNAIVNQVYGWAKKADTLLFIDIQTGHDNIRAVLPRFEWILKNPDVHLGIDPEFNLIKSKAVPGTRIGTCDASDLNYVSGYLGNLVKKYQLPPKVLVVHRFTRNALTNYRNIILRPEVQIVINMDGWGPAGLKRHSYRDFVVTEPVQFTGFKLFYHNDTKKGHPLLSPKEVLRLNPKPVFIMYQ